MTKSLFALAFAGTLALFAVATPAAAQVTISGCTSPQWIPASSTLQCGSGGSTAPVCSWPSTPPSSYTNTNTLTLTPSCPGASTYAWSVTAGSLGTGSCATGTSCTDSHTAGTNTSVTYQVIASNAVGPSNALTATVAWSDGSGAPTGCAIVPSAQSVPSGGGPIAPLVVSCSGGGLPTTWAWTSTGTCGSGTSTTATMTDTLPANAGAGGATCTYKVDVSNASGHFTPQPQATATAAGKGGAIACQPGGATPANVTTDLTNTIVQQLDWNQPAINPTSKFTKGTAWVGVINVPANATSAHAKGRVTWNGYGDASVSEWVTISATPCTWLKPGTSVATAFNPDSQIPNIEVGGSDPNGVIFQPGQTYYVNVQAWNPGTKWRTQCAVGTCNMTVELYAPY